MTTIRADTSGLELVADIGGTNARFALVDPQAATVEVLHAQTLCNAGFASLQHAAGHYLQSVGVQPRRAAIAVASPVDADQIHLTNRAWSFSRSELRETLGLEEFLLLNDFGAVASAVPALTPALRRPAAQDPRRRGTPRSHGSPRAPPQAS